MIQTKDITNSIYKSKTYILTKQDEDKAWLVDIGDIEPVVSYLYDKGLHVEGVFLTHAHFDHIYGFLNFLKHYPDCKVYVTEYAKEGLASEKLNMSKYHETPISYKGDNVIVVPR
jgi:glyoxylase-like metal-dependent hydrolase (beta-lactamase superfamily II)